jgi:hypothetical protein
VRSKNIFPYKGTNEIQSSIRQDSRNREAGDNPEDISEGISQLKRLRNAFYGLHDNNKENISPSKSETEPNDQEKENDVPALADTTAQRRQRTPFAPKENLQQYDTGQNRNPYSSEIGSNGQLDPVKRHEEIEQIAEELKRTPELRDKFDNLYTQILDIDPKVQGDATQLSKEIERIRENLEITPEQLEKFNKLRDAIPSDGQGDQTNGESRKVKGTRSPQKNEVNGEERSSEMPKVTQADIDKEIQKIERIRKWHDFIELMMAMPTRGNGY